MTSIVLYLLPNSKTSVYIKEILYIISNLRICCTHAIVVCIYHMDDRKIKNIAIANALVYVASKIETDKFTSNGNFHCWTAVSSHW